MDKILKAEEAGVLMDLAPMQSADFVSVEAREPAMAAPLSLDADSDGEKAPHRCLPCQNYTHSHWLCSPYSLLPAPCFPLRGCHVSDKRG